MSDASDYVGIKGWFATVKSMVPMMKEGKVSYVAGEMALLPYQKENRDFQMGGKNLCLDVFFHCYTEDVALKFSEEVKEGDMLIITGDLSEREWRTDDCNLKTNCWLDEFVIDPNKHTVSPLAAEAMLSEEGEFCESANYRFDETCCRCGAETVKLASDNRRYCPTCDD
jgi:hypothetical protein